MDIISELISLIVTPFVFLVNTIPTILIQHMPFVDYKLFGLIGSWAAYSIFWILLKTLSPHINYFGAMKLFLLLAFFFIFLQETPTQYSDIERWAQIHMAISIIILTGIWFDSFGDIKEDKESF